MSVGLRPTFDRLTEPEQELVDLTVNHVRLLLRVEGYDCPTGDQAARFDEAVAVLLTHCTPQARNGWPAPPQPGRKA